jgi:DNA-binding transcriptional ArsR family regulator
MVDLCSSHVDRVFQALSDATRRQMLATLCQQNATISELARPLEMSLAGVAKHVKVLEHAGLVDVQKAGRSHVCRINQAAFRTASQVLEYYQHFWNQRLDALETHFASRKQP